MDSLDHRISVAQRQVDDARRRVERQRRFIERDQASRHSGDLLALFKKSLRLFEDDLERLLKQKTAREG